MNADELTPAAVDCWRCGLASTPVCGACPHCGARLTDADPGPTAPGRDGPPVPAVLTVFTVMLAAALVWGWLVHFGGVAGERAFQVGTAVLEGFYTLLALGLWAAYGWPAVPRQTLQGRLRAWLVGGPLYALNFAFTMLYVWLLDAYLALPDWLRRPATPEELTPLNLILTVAQPALVEEFFFRGLVLGSVRAATGGTHGAVAVSAVTFALAHVYNPLGLPWLLAFGFLAGYLRVYGGLALPILGHAAHNFTVLLVEAAA